jgi:ADP-dependent NAD(P)H-hydrate dehydratase / NAD(P)H-hydrate epimerase
VVLAGPGNNGGDAYVVAAVLARRGASVSIVPYGSPHSEAADFHARRAASISRIVPDEVDLIVDGLFGAGSRPGLPEEVRHWANSSAPMLSLDLPSGLDADTGDAGEGTFRAD